MTKPLRSLPFPLVALGVVLASFGVAVSPDALHGFDRHVLPKEALLHVAALVVSWFALGRERQRDAVDVAASGFCALTFLSGVLAQNPWIAFRSFALTLSASVVFRAARVLAGAKHTTALCVVLTVGGVSCSLPALLEAFDVIDGWSTVGRAPSGTFGNRNAMAHAVALTLPATVYTVLRARTWPARVAAAFGLSLLVAAVTMSRCRAAWLGIAAAAALALVFSLTMHGWWRTRAVRRLPWVGLAVAFGVGVALLPNDLRWKSNTPYADSVRSFLPGPTAGLERRVAQASFTLDMAKDAPLFGVGPGNFRVYAPKYAASATARTAGPEQTITRLPNNDWLGVWAERGSLAVVCLLALAVAIARAFWRALPEERAHVVLGCVTGALLLPMAWFDAVLTQAVPVTFVAVGLGAVLPIMPRPSARLSAAPWFTAAMAFAALVRVGLQLWAGHLYAARPLTLERLTTSAELDPANEPLQRDLAELWIGRGDCERALPYIERLRAYYPHDKSTERVSNKCWA